MNPLTQLKKTTALLVIPLTFVCFALVQNTQAVVPAPDGYPGNTAKGRTPFNLTSRLQHGQWLVVSQGGYYRQL
jgi:hypothetical protein